MASAGEARDALLQCRPHEPRSWMSRSSIALAVLGPPVALGLLAWMRRWTTDDGFIFYRVVDQLVRGNGPVFNAGERVELATSTLWVAILTLFRLLLPDSVALENIGLWLALLGSVFGLAAAGAGAMRVARAAAGSDLGGVAVPFGALVVVAIVAFWDYSTSGLEMGLVFAWLGGCFWASTGFERADLRTRARTRWILAVLLGLGPLIRPDLLLFSVCFLGGDLAADVAIGWARRVVVLATAAALPIAYQLFRMGYYGALVPNTAIAKNASGVEWHRGVEYSANLGASYALWVALPLVAAVIALTLARLRQRSERRMLVVVIAPVLAALLHALYIVRLGGDHLHARLLLPALFAFLMPVTVIVVQRVRVAALAGVLALWALICSLTLRPLPSEFSVNAHRYYVYETRNAHPVTLEDWRRMPWLVELRRTQRVLRQGRIADVPYHGTWFRDRSARLHPDAARRFPLARDIEARDAFAVAGIGAVAFSAGVDVFIIDRLGLADPVGGRTVGLPDYFPTGHRRLLSLPWVEARFAAHGWRDPNPLLATAAALARRAQGCGDLARLLRDVDAPLTPGRFLGNVADAFDNTRLTVPTDAYNAHRKFCGTHR